MDAGRRCWVVTRHLDEVQRGAEGGLLEAPATRVTSLRRLGRGDGVAFYSPRSSVEERRLLQHLTALAEVSDDEPSRVGADDGSTRWRRSLVFETTRPVPVRPLLPLLGFVDDERRWTLPFRAGLVEVTAGDFGVIAGALRDAARIDDAYSAIGRSARA